MYVKNNKFMSLDGEVKEVGSPEWFKKLNAVNKFSIEIGGILITCRAESREGTRGRFWAAYRKIGGKTNKKYIGVTEKVTLLKLLEICQHFKELQEATPVVTSSAKKSSSGGRSSKKKVTHSVTQLKQKYSQSIEILDQFLKEKKYAKGGSSERCLIVYRKWLKSQQNSED